MLSVRTSEWCVASRAEWMQWQSKHTRQLQGHRLPACIYAENSATALQCFSGKEGSFASSAVVTPADCPPGGGGGGAADDAAATSRSAAALSPASTAWGWRSGGWGEGRSWAFGWQ